MDLKSISTRSLPYLLTLRKSSHLLGPKVVQIAWVRDITKIIVEDFARNSSIRRLLKRGLTDGHSEVAAVEYPHIPAIPDDVVPGTKGLSDTVLLHACSMLTCVLYLQILIASLHLQSNC